MIRFDCDYCDGGHPLIIERLIATNKEQSGVYSRDQYCAAAREKIYEAIAGGDPAPWREGPKPDIHFLVGGTQTNTVVVASALKPFQGVICAASGHINVHETGAVESTGHKIISIPSDTGKITAAQISEVYDAHYFCSSPEHCVQPAMVYISQPTETGLLYTKQELIAINDFCRSHSLFFYVDGARLGYGMQSPVADFTLADLVKLTDCFYIGGTKVGALFGEAMVIMNDGLKRDFRYNIKQHGGLLAKGRLLGIQFETLFTDGLYFTIAQHAIDEAMKLRSAFSEKGIPLLYDSYTNLQFPIFENGMLKRLEKKYIFDNYIPVGTSRTAVRICTDWTTNPADTDALINDLK